MIPVSACSRLLGTLSVMPSIGVQGLSQQNSALLQRVSVQQQRLYSASPAGQSGTACKEYPARFSTSSIRSFVRFSAGLGIASYCLYECSKVVSLEERLYSEIENKRWDEATSLMNRYELSAKCREEFLLLAISYGGYDFVEPYIEKYEWSTEFIENFAHYAAKDIRGYKFIKFFIETGKLSPQKLFYHPAFEPICESSTFMSIPAFENSLLYTVIVYGIINRNSEEEIWSFVNYLLEKGANFLQVEDGSLERGYSGCTTGEKCLESLFNMHRGMSDIEKLFEISNGDLGPRAVFILEKKRDYYEENLKNSYSKEYYLDRILRICVLIEKLHGKIDRIQG